MTFTSIAETDLETSPVSDAESPLDESDLDETYNPTKDKQAETEGSSNSGESGQEKNCQKIKYLKIKEFRVKYPKILWRKKHTIDLRERKVSTTENKMWKTDGWEKSTRGKRKWGDE